MNLLEENAARARERLNTDELRQELASKVSKTPRRNYVELPKDHPVIRDIESRKPWNRIRLFIKRRFGR